MVFLSKFFGENSGHYLNKIKLPSLNNFEFTLTNSLLFRIESIEKYEIGDENKQKILNLLNEPNFFIEDLSLIIDKLFQIRDHIDLLKKLIGYGVNEKFRFNNYIGFNSEHLKFSKLLSEVKKEYYGVRTYQDEFIKTIEVQERYFNIKVLN